MSRKVLILTTLVVVVASVLFGRYVLAPASQPATRAVEQSAAQDGAAESASRAMTFTEPKAPAK